MLEPRKYESWIKTRPNMRFLGGTAGFDLWYRDDSEAWDTNPNADVLPYLRVVRISNSIGDWDEFRLPLHINKVTSADWLNGRWGDVQLNGDHIYQIEAYLRCFAPGVLGEPTNEEDT